MNNTITLSQFKDILTYLIKNNRKLVDEGKNPLAVNIIGSAGVGKTTVIEDFCREQGMTYAKVSLSQMCEVSELSGFPIKEYEVVEEDGSHKWVPADVLQKYFQMPCGTYELTGESRMAYATPTWLPREENPKGTIVVLDDFSRANSLFMQAIMELINTGKYMTWKLPKYTSILLTSNPSDVYDVTELDPAQKSRLITFPIAFNLDDWAAWAERYGMDNRLINFGLVNGNKLFEDIDKINQIVNPRNFTMFGNAIAGIPNWEDSSSLALILNIAKGCFNDPYNKVGTLFTTFIANKLDKLISPEDILTKDWDTIKEKIEACVYDGDKYRYDIAAILEKRLLNYAMTYFETKKGKTDVVQQRIIDLIEAPEKKDGKKLFSDDALFHLIKNLMAKYPSRTNKFIMNAKIRKNVIA